MEELHENNLAGESDTQQKSKASTIWYTQYKKPMVTHCPTMAVTSGSSNYSHHHRAWVKAMDALLAQGFLLALQS
eukprot:7716559-Ditylum_brightwellii.AAC.1